MTEEKENHILRFEVPSQLTMHFPRQYIPN
jgi:hypothetical protein